LDPDRYQKVSLPGGGLLATRQAEVAGKASGGRASGLKWVRNG
jgi:hypothetical protein